MKINGRVVQGKNRVVRVFPRHGEEPIVIIAEAVSDLGRVLDILTPPIPPVIQKAGEAPQKNFDDPGYQQQVINHNALENAWLLLESLKPSNIEWQTVKMDKPKTWLNWKKEFQDAGFCGMEIAHIVDAVNEANALDESKLEAARQVFLRGQAAAQKSTSGQNTQPQSSPSGTPVSVSE